MYCVVLPATSQVCLVMECIFISATSRGHFNSCELWRGIVDSKGHDRLLRQSCDHFELYRIVRSSSMGCHRAQHQVVTSSVRRIEKQVNEVDCCYMTPSIRKPLRLSVRGTRGVLIGRQASQRK